MAISVVLCRSGLERHAPGLGEKVEKVGGVLTTVDCFDRCEQCELFLLCRLDGIMTRFGHQDALVEAVTRLQEDV